MEIRWMMGRLAKRLSIRNEQALLITLLLAFALLSTGLESAAGARHASQGDKVSIQAVNVPLADLLHRISEQSGVPLVLYPSAKEPINLESHDEDLGKLVNGLLRDYNYVLHYHDLESGSLSKIFVISRKTPAKEVQRGLAPELMVKVNEPALDQSPAQQEVPITPAKAASKSTEAAPSVGKNGPPPLDPAHGEGPHTNRRPPRGDGRFVKMTRTGATDFGGVFTAPTDQMEQVPLTLDNSEGFFHVDQASPPRSGLRLKTITPGSPLAILGLAEGDVVREINGRPVQSAAELTAQLGKSIGQGDGAAFIIGVERPVLQASQGLAGAGNRGATITPQHIYVQFIQ